MSGRPAIRFRVYRDRNLANIWVAHCYGCLTSTAARSQPDALSWVPRHVDYHREWDRVGG